MEYQISKGLKQHFNKTELDRELELLSNDGYFLRKDVISDELLTTIRAELDIAWEVQLKTFGKDLLLKLNEWGIVRCLCEENKLFIDLITQPEILKVIDATVGSSSILHLQNGIIIDSSKNHNQSIFHRDFPKDFLPSKILSINALIIIDEFTKETGGTFIVPGSHKLKELPSDEYMNNNSIPLNAKPGSILFFDSLLWHKAGKNASQNKRRAINQQYTKPFIKQQIDYPSMIKKDMDMNSRLAQIMGFWSVPSKNLKEFRVSDPNQRTYKKNQG